MGIYGQCHERYCFVTLTFNLKVTGGFLKVRFWPFFHFLAQFSYTESQIILWLVYIIHIYVLCKHAETSLKLFIEGHPLTAKVPDRGSFLAFLEIFSHLMLTILHGNY